MHRKTKKSKMFGCVLACNPIPEETDNEQVTIVDLKKYACRDKTCLDKIMFVATKYFCRTFVATNTCLCVAIEDMFCRDMFLVTKVSLLRQIFVATKVFATKMFAATSILLSAPPANDRIHLPKMSNISKEKQQQNKQTNEKDANRMWRNVWR